MSQMEASVDSEAYRDLGVLPSRLHHHLPGRQGHGPDDAVRVVILFDGRRRGAADADAVAPHHDRPFHPLVVQEGGPQGLRVFGPELEDVV